MVTAHDNSSASACIQPMLETVLIMIGVTHDNTLTAAAKLGGACRSLLGPRMHSCGTRTRVG